MKKNIGETQLNGNLQIDLNKNFKQELFQFKNTELQLQSPTQIQLVTTGFYSTVDNNQETNFLIFSFLTRDHEEYVQTIEVQLSINASCCGYLHYNLSEFNKIKYNKIFELNNLLNCIQAKSDCSYNSQLEVLILKVTETENKQNVISVNKELIYQDNISIKDTTKH